MARANPGGTLPPGVGAEIAASQEGNNMDPEWLQRLRNFLSGMVGMDAMHKYGRPMPPDMSGMSFPGTIGQGAEQPQSWLQVLVQRLFGGGQSTKPARPGPGS